MHLEEPIRREGLRLGFSRVAFAEAREHPGATRLREWLDSGYAGSMEYLGRRLAERSDPQRLIPWARTLIVASFPYSHADPPTPPLAARISRYARGRDYHEVLKERLESLGAFVAQLSPGARCSPVVDTGAILEKPWGAAAGLGWQGKHTNLIDPQAGSWFFLGELVTDLSLTPDEPQATDRCGTCTRCLEACPTQAFPEAYVLDARRCVSYLTVEHKGTIPEELRAGIGDRVFGCDVCQEVCPWNARAGAADAAQPGAAPLAPALGELMALTREEFNRRFAGTALRRTGWSRFLRNVAIALGNSGDPAALPPLRRALAVADPLIREHVIWALQRLEPAGAASPGEMRESA